MKTRLFELTFQTTIVFLLCYAFGLDFIPTALSIIISLLNYFISERLVPSQLKVKMLSHIAVGASFGFSWGVYENYLSTVVSVSIAAFFMALSGRLERDGEDVSLRGSILAGLTLGLMYGSFIANLAALFSGLIYGAKLFAGIFIFTFILTILGILTGKFLKPKIDLFSKFLPYLIVMKDAGIAFAVGYVFIGLIFAVLFACDWRLAGGNTLKLPDNQSAATFFDFVYFSFITIATVGYGDILPLSKISRILVVAEIIIGIGWITVVFAAITAYLQKPFSELLTEISASAGIRDGNQTPLDG